MAKKKRDLVIGLAVEHWIRNCAAAGMTDATLDGYEVIGRQFLSHIDPGVLIRDISAEDIEAYLLVMRTEKVIPAGIAKRDVCQRRPKTIKNMHTGLASLWSWALSKGYVDEHVVREVPIAPVPRKPIKPLTPQDILKLIRACEKTRSWRSDPLVQTERPTALRDKMIIYLMLETCVRVSEAVNLTIGDVTLHRQGGEVYVREGKGGKDRIVPFGRRCAAIISDYLLSRPDATGDDYLIINEQRNHNKPMTRDTLGRLIKRIGQRAGVDRVHPHLLRTTGACMMAANGMTAFQLQRVMGHSDISTTQRYVEAANMDMSAAMARSSPIDNLRL